MTQLTIDRDFVTSTLTDLVRINSVNPSLAPGAPGEPEIAAHVEALMRRLGMKTAAIHPAFSIGRAIMIVQRGQAAGWSRSITHRG